VILFNVRVAGVVVCQGTIQFPTVELRPVMRPAGWAPGFPASGLTDPIAKE
jgi:hypothetical protein